MEVRFEDHYFPNEMRWATVVLLGVLDVYLLFWIQAYVFVAILILVKTLIFKTKYLTIIDTKNKVIEDLLIVLFYKYRKTIKYNELKGIRIDRKRLKYEVKQTVRNRTVDFYTYSGTLHYDRRKLELSTKSDYNWIGKEMKRLAEELQIPIEKSYESKP